MSNAVLTGLLNTLFLIYMTKYYQNHIFSFLKVWAKGKPRLCWLPAPGRRLTLCFDQSMHCNGGDFYFLSSLGVVTPFKITIIVDQSMIHSCYFSLVTPFPRTATVFGDPHVYTFDNIPYTFNGMGEHFMFLFLWICLLLFHFFGELILRRQFFPKLENCVWSGEYCVSCLIRWICSCPSKLSKSETWHPRKVWAGEWFKISPQNEQKSLIGGHNLLLLLLLLLLRLLTTTICRRMTAPMVPWMQPCSPPSQQKTTLQPPLRWKRSSSSS